jgi:HTH-type transcriptional regulator/antitoxin HipB
MRVRTTGDIGAFIRERRSKLGLNQLDVAKKIGVSRKWLGEIERGKRGAEVGLILRALKSLDVAIDLKIDLGPSAKQLRDARKVDINGIINALKRQR